MEGQIWKMGKRKSLRRRRRRMKKKKKRRKKSLMRRNSKNHHVKSFRDQKKRSVMRTEEGPKEKQTVWLERGARQQHMKRLNIH
jgi:hypothetical protein